MHCLPMTHSVGTMHALPGRLSEGVGVRQERWICKTKVHVDCSLFRPVHKIIGMLEQSLPGLSTSSVAQHRLYVVDSLLQKT